MVLFYNCAIFIQVYRVLPLKLYETVHLALGLLVAQCLKSVLTASNYKELYQLKR